MPAPNAVGVPSQDEISDGPLPQFQVFQVQPR